MNKQPGVAGQSERRGDRFEPLTRAIGKVRRILRIRRRASRSESTYSERPIQISVEFLEEPLRTIGFKPARCGNSNEHSRFARWPAGTTFRPDQNRLSSSGPER